MQFAHNNSSVGIGATTPASRLVLCGGSMTDGLCSDARMKQNTTLKEELADYYAEQFSHKTGTQLVATSSDKTAKRRS